MRSFLNRFFLTLLFVCLPTLTSAAQKFIFDPGHSYILFKIKHFDYSTQSGKWFVNGEMELDKDHPEKSKVEATVKVAQLVTGHSELDKHLKEKSFFEVDKYPSATFVSDKVEITGSDSAKVWGKLTVHGVTKQIMLNVHLNKAGVSPVSNKNTVGFSATTTLKRSDFGMKAFAPGLGDEVKIEIEVEAREASDTSKS